MLTYQVMQEAVKDRGAGEWVPALVWAWRPGGEVRVQAMDAFCQEQARYEESLRWARARRFSQTKIWEYWAQDGGNGYTNIRTRPEPVEAPSIDILLRREVRKLHFPPGTRDPDAELHFRTPDEDVIWLEPIRHRDHRASLERFVEELGPVINIPYPKTGSQYSRLLWAT